MTDRTFLAEAEEETLPLPAKRPSVLAYGTTVQDDWSEAWLDVVRIVERGRGTAICGAKRNQADLDGLIRTGKVNEEDIDNNETWVCSNRAGEGTQHAGKGLCYRHGGNEAGAKFSMITQPDFSSRIHNFFESEGLLDLRGAIATAWLAANSITDDDSDLSLNQAKELGALMSRIGNLTKQHNEIMEKRKISIEVPEFIAWAEHFYELAIKYILDGEKDVQGFLTEAKSYYDATVTIKVGIDSPGNSNRESDPFGSDEAQPVLGSGESES